MSCKLYCAYKAKYSNHFHVLKKSSPLHAHSNTSGWCFPVLLLRKLGLSKIRWHFQGHPYVHHGPWMDHKLYEIPHSASPEFLSWIPLEPDSHSCSPFTSSFSFLRPCDFGPWLHKQLPCSSQPMTFPIASLPSLVCYWFQGPFSCTVPGQSGKNHLVLSTTSRLRLAPAVIVAKADCVLSEILLISNE